MFTSDFDSKTGHYNDLSYKIQSLLLISTHTSQKSTLLASIYYSKLFSWTKYYILHNYYVLHRVIKVYIKQIEERIIKERIMNKIYLHA